MDDQHHYDGSGKYIGRSTTAQPGLGALILVGLLVAGGKWLWDKITHYQELEVPYRFFANYYYVVMVLPVRFAEVIYTSITTSGITHMPNLNLVIGVTAVIIYFIAIIALVVVAVRKIGWFFNIIFLYPAIFILLWFIASSTFNWLTKTT